MNKKVQKLLAVLVSGGLMMSFLPVNAETTSSTPVPVYSMDFSGYSSDSTEASKGITASGDAAQGSSITVNYSEGGVIKASPQYEINYMDFNVPERTEGYNNNGIEISFADSIWADSKGKAKDMTVDFWINIPGPKLTGKYARYFTFCNNDTNDFIASEVFNLYNLNLDTERFEIYRGYYNDLYAYKLNMYDKWTHFTITQSVSVNADDTAKADYSTKIYVNGSFLGSKTTTGNTWYSAPNKLYLGVNLQSPEIEGTQLFKLSSFNVYDRILTDDEAATIYEATKTPYTTIASDTFEFACADSSKAKTDGIISIKFNNYPNEDISALDFSIDGKVPQAAVVNGKTIQLTAAAPLEDGEHLITLPDELISFNNIAYTGSKNIKIKIEDGLVFALDFSQAKDTDTVGDSEEIEDLAKTVGSTISSYADFAAEENTWGAKIPYLQLKRAETSFKETRIEAVLDDGILQSEDEYGTYCGDITVEFWAKIAKEQGDLSNDVYNKYGRVFTLDDASGKNVIFMWALGTTDRFNVSPGDGSDLYTTAGGKSVLDTWAHFVITRKCEYDSSNTEKPYKYTVTEYVNGESKSSRSQNIEARPGAVKTIGIGAVGNGTVDYKLYNFNIYNKQQTADWAQNKYNSEKEIFEQDTELFADGPVVINLDSISENFKLTGGQVDVKIKNIFKTDKPYSVMIAGYDNNGRLVCVKSSDKKQLIDGKNEVILECPMTEDVSEIKAFVWFEDMIPLSKAEKNDEFTVAFVGDSITHRGNYTKAIETYYTTRYPDKKINFVNKGINAHSFNYTLSRFDWDILNEPIDGLGEKAEMNARPDAMTVMLGVNDIGHGDYATQTEDEKAKRVNSVLTNAEALIKRCIDEKIELTIITPLLVDVKPDNWTDDMNLAEYGSNEGVGRVANGLLSLAEKYKKGGEFNSDVNVDVINMWKETTDLTQRIRSQDKTINVMTDNDVDQVHPDSNGGFVMGYFFAKNAKLADGSAANSSVVASVKIDAASNTLGEIVNAEAELINASADSITYKYRPNALPMPVSKEYEYAEQTLGLPVTEDLNKELITVTGLSDGNYKIMIDGIELTQTHTADELAAGVNIATDKNNPGQISALASYEEICNKATIENYYRWIAQRFAAFMVYYPGA
ncbi:MAG: LamG-like jellyroll fold domain-containing protein, partial [Clostridia bacterium]|nr:LamG-like jellyroll fold domain-containing protein [Clostridia bacterium]